MRPAGLLPQWASDPTYPAGSDPWSSQANKVDPGATLTQQGFAPGTYVPAEFVNFILNQFYPWLKYHDLVEVTNFRPGFELQLWIDTSVKSNTLIYSEPNLVFLAAGSLDNAFSVPAVFYSFNGETWNNDGAPNPGAGWYQICGSDDTNVLAVWTGASQKVYLRTAGVWGADLGAHGQTIKSMIYVPGNSLFLLGGGSTHPSVHTLSKTGTNTTQTLPGGSSVSGPITLMATNGTRTVVIASNDLWWSDDLVTWNHFVSGLLFGGESPVGLVWWDAEQIFLVTTPAGNVWISTDGAVWTNGSGGHTGGFYWGLAVLGGAIVAQAKQPSPFPAALAVGLNKGAGAWQVVNSPLPGIQVDRSAMQEIVTTDNRIALVGVAIGGTANDSLLSYSLRSLP